LDEMDGESERGSVYTNHRTHMDEDDATEEQVDERSGSPDLLIVRQTRESLGPSEEADTDFAKELARMMAEPSNEIRKVDKRTALSLWDSSSISRKKRLDQTDGTDGQESDSSQMKFTVISRRGHRQQVHELSIPSMSALAIHTRSAQLQDKAEHEELKRLVLNYEQREEEALRTSSG